MTELLDRPMEQSREGETNAGARGNKLSSSPPKVRLPGKGAPSPQSVGVAARSSRAGSGESTALRERSGFPPSAWLSQKAAAFRHDDGDVPGWVLITLMTAGLVIIIWGLAGPALSRVFEQAIERVTGF